MKAIQYFNGVTLALASSFGVTLSVVVLMYAVYLEREPRLREDWPLVVSVTAIFVALMAFSGLAFWAQRHDKSWRAIAQAALFAAIVAGVWSMYRLLI